MPARHGRQRDPRATAAALIALALACAVGVLYLPAIGFQFVTLDDLAYVRDNPLVREGLTGRGAARAFSIQQNTWIPLTWVSFMVEASVAGLDPRVFHATNVLLHSATAGLLLLLLWRMTGALWRSALAAALVALHPLRVESVAWITERKDTLSMLFLVLALACWLRRVRSGRARWYAAAVACFALALSAKPMPLTLPLLLLVLDYWPLGRLAPGGGFGAGVSRLIIEKIPLLTLSAVSAAVTLAGRSRELPPLTMPDRIGMFVSAPFIYLGRMFWPANLGIRYFQEGRQPGPALSFAAALALAVLTLLALRAWRPRPYLAAGWLWYLTALVPVSGMVATGVQWIADRFAYLPHLGLAIAVAWGAAEAAGSRPRARVFVPLAAAAALVALAAASRLQMETWRDGVSLMRRAVELEPASPPARAELGHALLDRGYPAAAAGELSAALAANPELRDARFNLASSLAKLGRNEEAIGQYRELLARSPSDLMGRFNLAIELANLGRDEEAVGEYRKLLASSPSDLMARLNLAELLFWMKLPTDAAAEFRAAAALAPGTAEGEFALGRMLTMQGKTSEAQAHYLAAAGLPSALPHAPSRLREVLASP